jgi:NADH-quinone oxidoreductase subunit E
MPYAAGFQKSDRQLSPEGEAFAFSPEQRQKFGELATHYPPEQRKSTILYALFMVQDRVGYLSAAGMRHVAEVIGCSTADVEDVATYYAMYYKQPVGKHVIQVCRTLSCALAGAERVTESLGEKLGLKAGETDGAGMFTLMEFECLGACDRAPVVMVNDAWHECLTPEKAAKLVDDLRARGEEALSGCHHVIEKKNRAKGSGLEGKG